MATMLIRIDGQFVLSIQLLEQAVGDGFGMALSIINLNLSALRRANSISGDASIAAFGDRTKSVGHR